MTPRKAVNLRGGGRRAGLLLAVLLLVAPVWGAATAQEANGEQDLPLAEELDLEIIQSPAEPPVDTRWQELLGRGDWIVVKVGSALFGVVYGNGTSPLSPTVFVYYERLLAQAEVHNTSGGLLREGDLVLRTVMAQSFEALWEFRDGNGDGLFHPPRLTDFLTGTEDFPRKFLNLSLDWDLEDLAVVTEGDAPSVNFNVTARNLPYTRTRPAEEVGDGLVSEVTFAFHLRVDRTLETLDVNVYRVVVDETGHPVTPFEFNRTEEVRGVAVNSSFKYDHYLLGWDFADEDSRLALSTALVVGAFTPEKVRRWVDVPFHIEGDTDGEHFDEGRTLNRPLLLTDDQFLFRDEWSRVGHLEWTSDVAVDGAPAQMTFQLHDAGKILHHLFRGFWMVGMFIYPPGDAILHDPGMGAGVFIPVALGDVPFGLGPYLAQLAVVSLAVVGLAVYRFLGRKPGSPPA